MFQPAKLAISDEMSASDSQNVQHIQSSCPEYKEDCLTAAPSAAEFAMARPKSWPDLCALSESLARGLGIPPRVLAEARQGLGPVGSALAAVGLIQALDRIASPTAYPSRLITQAQEQTWDLDRMFRSLIRPRHTLGCLPG